MSKSLITRGVLVLAGLIGLIVGAGILFAPVAFHATSGIHLGGDVNLANEMRAAGGPLIAGGLFVLAGAVWQRFTLPALGLATALYLSYGAGRLFSMAVDGIPNQELVMIAMLEWAIGAACGWALLVQIRKRAVASA
ncbi:MAG: DUF4345 domain-containing protein [Hyphomonas sp.]|tara:strand:- start:2111 stop:2521 length:411 start_codon:yes stop_codon:yes gene_type:complete